MNIAQHRTVSGVDLGAERRHIPTNGKQLGNQ